MRPQNIEQYIGQQHLLGVGKPLRRALEAGQIHSMILWGPPGTGKTTLAEVAANYTNAEVERVSAVTSGVKDIRAAIEKAKENQTTGRRTILFVDEVHRFNKSQQDAFLPHIEDGTITFIGATTENPSFELNNALLSRARDLISAVHKSIRGSNPDAALYWTARIIAAGGDPLYVVRRLLAIASEDIGNADPRAMEVALNAWDCFTRIGPAEGERAIAQAVVYLACAPKSNAVYTAWKQAQMDAINSPDYDVPNHLRNAPTSLMKDMGYGADYRYAHDEPNAYASGENYFPPEMQDRKYYFPTKRGLETKISEKLEYLAKLDQNSTLKRYQ
ncbi:UNVERIFIED_CONTAM: hypothetical protein GTU68_048716 [Idotea baltica]|nr:hypothetical protein [Idotea baltica]